MYARLIVSGVAALALGIILAVFGAPEWVVYVVIAVLVLIAVPWTLNSRNNNVSQ